MPEARTMVDPLIGRTIGGRYRLIQRLGSGGMSSVYLARHVLIDRLMAIKTLRRDLASDPVQRDRFIREARAVNRINHENIVEITDFGEAEDGLVYLVMEYVPGEPLLRVMSSQGPFSIARAFDIAQQIGSALARAHQMGVVHRDLKPENILIVQKRDRKDFVKILDFGIAKILDAPSLTGSQQIFGTPGYIAPEYIQSTNIDGRADLYSLGVILYEMVTGALPFDYEYPGDLLVKHVTEQPIPPTQRRPEVPGPVEALVLRCLVKDPQDRFRDAYHFLSELRAVRERLGPATSWGALNEPGVEVGRALDEHAPTPDVLAASRSAHEDDSSERDELRTTQPSRSEVHDTPLEPERLPRGPAAPGGFGRVTAEYARPVIPEPPRDDLEIEVEVDVAAIAEEEKAKELDRATQPAPAPEMAPDGLFGVRRWRKRFDAIRAWLDELEMDHPAPAEIDHAMAFAARTLESLEESVAVSETHQATVESLGVSARDYRATLGRTIDELAGELSKRRGELEQLVRRRDELAVRREVARAKVRDREATEGEADALLWELAAVEEDVRVKAGQCDELEAQVTDLRDRLDRENERFEGEIASLVAVLDVEMQRLEGIAAALRAPLERAEKYVRDRWPDAR
ncbi:serine/threonine-protein kinase [Sandaracinus amylolyticus]|uniref:Serine/threonine protein kinase n=1 Tax=Sandaracinus amylolyticus TaxID=927083 RepID=A0A0F6SH10_9BACT|nr:serine/threonine-protein kinase [Sandaracinus amylolyticus]AKF09629.1 serine/threonine protein kinase [Sandaracinus amylolyticus]